MRNLAGPEDRTHATDYFTDELERCGIEVVRYDGPHTGEVQSQVYGKLGDWTFRRAWYYTVVKGPTPLSVAKELYENRVGRNDIRVAGHCACPPPEDPWVTWRDKISGKEIARPSEREKVVGYINKADTESGVRMWTSMLEKMDNEYEWGDPADGVPTIDSYHIDSELGLYVFVQTLKAHNLV